MRQNFYDILRSARIKPNEIYQNLVTLFFKETEEIRVDSLWTQSYSLYSWIEKNFRQFPYKRCCISLKEFDDRMGFKNLHDTPKLFDEYESQVNALIILCEYVLNFLMYISFPRELCAKRDITLNYIDEINNELHLVKTHKRDGVYIITHADPVIEALTTVVEEDIALSLVEYTHHSMEGNIEKKKSILSSLAKNLEAKRDSLNNIAKDLVEAFFCGVNNLDIRHDNKTLESKNYNQNTLSLSNKELEKVYDKLFRIGLTLFSILESKEDICVIKNLSNRKK